jgi:hypothetical protein
LVSKEQAVKLIDAALRKVALGMVVNLDSHFYMSRGRSFAESLVEDPVGTYREMLQVVPESMARTMIRIAIRSLGSFSVVDIEKAIEALKEGDPGPFQSPYRGVS